MTFYKRNQNQEYKNKMSFILAWAKKIKMVEMLGGKCKNCGETRIQVLSFHHLESEEKEYEPSKLRSCRWSNIEKEIIKCVCLCENCHRELHSLKIAETNRYNKNKKLLLECINKFSCEKCGYDKCNSSLCFHHINPKEKEFVISENINGELYFVSDIKLHIINELNKCKVLCSNCHQDEHFENEKFELYKNEIYEKAKNIKEQKLPFNKQEVLKMYKSGMKQIEISKTLNCSRGTICEILREFGLGNNLSDIKIDEEKFLHYHNEGKRIKEICKLLNCKLLSLYNLYKKNNIKPNKIKKR